MKNKKKYFEFKTNIMDPKDFKHEKIELYVEPRAYKRIKDMLHKIGDSFIDKKKIKQGKKTPIIISRAYQGKWKVAGPINTPQTHNLIVGGLVSKDYENSWKKQFRSMSNVDLLNIKINHKEEMFFDRDNNAWHYESKEYDYVNKLLKERRK
jgi:hypothetical protein